MLDADRRIPWDWYPGRIPENVLLDESVYVETSFSFFCCRSQQPIGVVMGRGSSAYNGTMFDFGPRGKVKIGDYVLVVCARIVCDSEIEIGDFSLLSWNVVLMDSYRASLDPDERKRELEEAALRKPRLPMLINGNDRTTRPIRIGRNV